MRFLSLLLLFAPAFAFAHEGVAVSDGWAPPSLSQKNGVGFLTINAADENSLTGVSSDCCQAVEMHTHVMDGDIMRMRRIDAVPLPDHQDVVFAPGGYHLMLIGLKEPLTEGMKVPLTLHFAKTPEVKTELTVDRGKLLERLKTPLKPEHEHHH